jgi:hypothetical protein
MLVRNHAFDVVALLPSWLVSLWPAPTAREIASLTSRPSNRAGDPCRVADTSSRPIRPGRGALQIDIDAAGVVGAWERDTHWWRRISVTHPHRFGVARVQRVPGYLKSSEAEDSFLDFAEGATSIIVNSGNGFYRADCKVKPGRRLISSSPRRSSVDPPTRRFAPTLTLRLRLTLGFECRAAGQSYRRQ